MIRFAINLALLVALAAWIAAQDGALQLTWGDKHIELHLTAALTAVVILFVLWWGVAKVWFAIKYGFARRREKKLRLQQEKGLAALTLTFGALAGNDLRLAQKAQRRADKLLGAQPLVNWLGAELAARRGNQEAANEAYRKLASDPAAALLGWRGLLRADGQPESQNILSLTAEALANRDVAKQAFVHDVRLRELAQRHDWAEAVMALHTATTLGAYTKTRARQLGVVLEIMYAHAVRTEDAKRAQSGFERAYKQAPDFIPAATAYIDDLLQTNDRGTANKVIRAVWLMKPHLDLLDRFIRANENESPIARLQRFEQFALKRKDSVTTQLALAQLCITADVFGKARTHLQQAQAIRATRQGYQLLADLAQDEANNDQLAHDYVRQAMRTAPVGHWTCAACNSQHESCQPLCHACGALGEIDWSETSNSNALAVVGQ